jgi:hypothetical protein
MYLALAGATALLVAAACMDSPPTSAPRSLAPKGVSRGLAGAGFTTFTSTADCKDGGSSQQNAVDCNNYASKDGVDLRASGLPGGTYFFAVLDPGGQNVLDGAPLGSEDFVRDGTPGLPRLSSDSRDCRTFDVTDGVISYTASCAHTQGLTPDYGDGSARSITISLQPYDDTPNPGGVYVLAICAVNVTNAKDCKYDAFRISFDGSIPASAALGITKTANGAFDKAYSYGITKTVLPTTLQHASSAVFNYTVTVTQNAATIISSSYVVSGTVTVTNPNFGTVTISGITDLLTTDPTGFTGLDGASCTFATSPASTVIPAATLVNGIEQDGSRDYAYSCTLSGAPPVGGVYNRATVSWGAQTVAGANLAAGSKNFVTTSIISFAFSGTYLHPAVKITDVFDGTSTTLNTSATSFPATFNYSHTVTPPANSCVTKNNTATYLATDDASITGSANASASVCANDTGGLTIGFWQNNNGQAKLAGAGVNGSGVCLLTVYLRGFAPFQDLSQTATCGTAITSTKNSAIINTTVTAYVYTLVKAASASGATMDAMLKAQMLATALSAYFTPGLGTANIDLSHICSTGISNGTCSIFVSYSTFWGGSPKSVNTLLGLASTAFVGSNGVGTWYGAVKSDQEKAKNTFDTINNGLAWIAP